MTEREQREALESNGCRVKIAHFRRPLGWGDGFVPASFKRFAPFEPKGGLTLVTIKYPDGRVACGEARCMVVDNFSRVRGREIALGRAVQDAKAQDRAEYAIRQEA